MPDKDEGSAAAEAQTEKRCGFVAVLGAPNVGKSTLVNRIVGTKVSIVSPKVQTTRARVLGIAIIDASQVLLVDTPGLFQPTRRLDQAMVSAAWEGASGADEVMLLVDSTRGADPSTGHVVDWLATRRRKAILVLNKIDAVEKRLLLALAHDLDATSVFSRLFMISALTGDGVNDLASYLASTVPPGPWLYPEDQVSDMPGYLLAAEITREKLFWRLQQELPYAVAVETESWTTGKDGSVRIEQTIFVEREGQRAIVIGKGGQQIKRVGETGPQGNGRSVRLPRPPLPVRQGAGKVEGRPGLLPPARPGLPQGPVKKQSGERGLSGRRLDGHRDPVEGAHGVIERLILAIERPLSIGQRQAVLVDLTPDPVLAGMRRLHASVEAAKEAAAAGMRLGDDNVVDAHGAFLFRCLERKVPSDAGRSLAEEFRYTSPTLLSTYAGILGAYTLISTLTKRADRRG